MTTTARAVVLTDVAAGPNLETVTVDDPGAGEVLVRVAASGVCGSDLHLLHGRSNVSFLPAVMGHEGAGVVEAVGRDVTDVRVGERVVIAMSAPCGACGACSRGQLHLCESPSRMNSVKGQMADGSTRIHRDGEDLYPFVGCGTLAELVVVPARQLVLAPDDVPLELAALSACGVITGLGAVFNIARVQPGDTTLVVGCGGVGLSVVQGCRIAGAATIIAADLSAARRDAAGQAGATRVVDPAVEDVADVVRGIVPNGVDEAFEVVGHAPLVGQLLELVRPGGTCVATASYAPGSEIVVRPQALFWDRTLRGCVAGNSVPRRDIPRIMRLHRSGALDLGILAGERWALDDVMDAFGAADRGEVPRAIVTMAC